MAQPTQEQRVENLERRVATVEQILPTLATKADLADLKTALKADLDAAIAPLATKAELQAAIAPLATKAELQAAIAPLATKAELQAAIAPLATKAEVKAEGEQTRRYFDIVAERQHADIRMIAEGLAALQERTDTRHADVMSILTQHDRRLIRLESRPKRRGPT